ncbi:cell division protein SepF [Clostridium sp. MSJ-11]|uniref:Cell division protein SepF n=1 Tax=Clostridium mobile TaxID=2841512 RepID=A0ABS6ECQ7_9CLOT|nr:cell division protein SepF [Clostridium mobile]MBU5482978.1 cell division protein SepF [Clostridium mobile]
MSSILNKMMGLLKLEDEYDEFDEDIEAEEMEESEEEFEPIVHSSSRKPGKVVSIHTAATAKVVIVKPSTYDEVVDICDNLKNRKIIVVNSTALEQKTAQRLLDFISGATYALAGSLEEVERGIYIVSPSNVEVDTTLKSELSSKGLFAWTK